MVATVAVAAVVTAALVLPRTDRTAVAPAAAPTPDALPAYAPLAPDGSGDTLDQVGSQRQAAVEVLGGELVPGQPLVARQVHDDVLFTVTVTPARPGPNLVRVDTRSMNGTGRHTVTARGGSHDGAPVTVGLADGPSVRASPRPGVGGLWARVRLPEGAGQVLVSHGRDHRVPFPVDTGSGTPASPATTTRADGAECAVAQASARMAGGTDAAPCPSDALGTADADALRQVVRLLADRGARVLTLSSDDSARGRAAGDVVRRTATAAGLPVRGTDEVDPSRPRPGSALLVTSGWTAGAEVLATTARAQRRGAVHDQGVWLAPWLLTPQLVDAVPGVVLPLRFDVRGEEAVRFTGALQRLLPGSTPTGSGFLAWAQARGVVGPEPASLYAASRAAYLPASSGHATHQSDVAWFPGGTVTRVSGPLAAPEQPVPRSDK
ncbi:hypothetical protein [Nocardioides iriomotensis]|uniref:Uncharacterized protein n=1 Tax=Nocardioides iriomotensis TaxID=715784 RepID=A0A4Q5J1T5_9ACTN|nr:hypothetical protein [Nocardioides iriomotensis]RYU12374.1 hypothetical protein ETU37_10210 [Nocardioides iriomotensis]